MMPPDTLDKLYQIAETQAGYFTTAQAETAGIDRSRLSRFVAAGRLLRVRHGVYRLVHFPHSRHEDLFIAWLQIGPDSIISHDSALALYELSDAMPAKIHVTIPRTASRRRHGLQLHTGQINRDDVTNYEGLPVTTIARTITDLALAGLAIELIQQAVGEALARGLVQPEDLATIARHRGPRVAQVIEQAIAQCRPRSEIGAV